MPLQRSELFLILMILFFFSLALLFLILLINSRLSKIEVIKKRKLFEPIADNAIFSIIFEDKSYLDLLNNNEYGSKINDDFFRTVLLESVVKLHKNYSGEYAKKIEIFYIESTLIDDTYAKLNGNNWSVQCDAIGELAEMNIQESHSIINKYITSKNLILRQEAFKAIVRLKGIEGLAFLHNYKEPLSDWIQLNLLSIIKNNSPSTLDPYYNSFITSSNISVATFGKRLKTFYEQNSEAFSERKNIEAPDVEDVSTFYNAKKERVGKHLNHRWQKQKSLMLSVGKKVTFFSFVLFLFFIGTHLIELITNKISSLLLVLYYSIINDIYLTIFIALFLIPVIWLFALLWKKSVRYSISIIYITIIIIHLLFSIFFFGSKTLLGSEISSGSASVILNTFAGFISNNHIYILFFIFIFIFSIFIFFIFRLNSLLFFSRRSIKSAVIILISIFIFSAILKKENVSTLSDYENLIAINKTGFFINTIFSINPKKIEAPFINDKQYYFSTGSDSAKKY